MRRLLYINTVLLILGIAANICLYFWGPQIMLFWINAKEGCFPWSAAQVEYHEGMTLCPGQSTKMTVPLTIEKPKSRAPNI